MNPAGQKDQNIHSVSQWNAIHEAERLIVTVFLHFTTEEIRGMRHTLAKRLERDQ